MVQSGCPGEKIATLRSHLSHSAWLEYLVAMGFLTSPVPGGKIDHTPAVKSLCIHIIIMFTGNKTAT